MARRTYPSAGQLAIDTRALAGRWLCGVTGRLREPPGSEASILQRFGAALATRIAEFSWSLLGCYATSAMEAETVPDAPRRVHRGRGPRQYMIAATSEIQHSIIGERILGVATG